MQTLTSRPAEVLAHLDRLAPGLWLKLDRMRRNAVQWPKEFALPTWACQVNDLVKLDAEAPNDGRTLEDILRAAPDVAAYWMARGIQRSDPILMLTAERAAMLYAWRTTKLEFRFDSDLARELLDTPVTDDIPANILNRLPASCIYVTLPEGTGEWAGFFAFLDQRDRKAPPVLRIFRDSPGKWPSQVFVLPISGGSLSAAVAQSNQKFQELAQGALEAAGDLSAAAKALASPDKVAYELRQLEKILSLLLYLCAEKPDLPDDYAPRAYREKGTGSLRRITPPEQVQVWPVGARIGAVFRKAEQAQNSPNSAGELGTTVRPHVRRAHWHTYWVGAKSASRATLRWVSPVLVGVKSKDDAIPAVIRPVAPE